VEFAMTVKILLVDDDEAFRAVTAVALESAGYAVREAADGYAALEAMRRDRPDLVISDLSMPGIDGREFCRRVRATPQFDGVRLLILSALVEADGAGGVSAPDADGCLSKQGCLTQLLGKVEALTARPGR
jgi:two-component system, OmpR family, response regulator MprA